MSLDPGPDPASEGTSRRSCQPFHIPGIIATLLSTTVPPPSGAARKAPRDDDATHGLTDPATASRGKVGARRAMDRIAPFPGIALAARLPARPLRSHRAITSRARLLSGGGP